MRDTKGKFHAKTGAIKDKNGMDLTEAEDIKRRWQEYTEWVKSLSHVRLFATPRTDCSLPGSSIHRISRQEYTEELYRKDLHDPDNHDGMIAHLEPDILECETKWALGSIVTNKASGGDGIPFSYFKSWKMMLWKCCTQYASKCGKLSSGHRTGKGQFSFQSQRKAMPKNAQTTAQLHSSHMLVK